MKKEGQFVCHVSGQEIYQIILSRKTEFDKNLSFVKESKDIFSVFLAEKLNFDKI